MPFFRFSETKIIPFWCRTFHWRLARCELNSEIPPVCLRPKLVSLLDCFFKQYVLEGILSICFFLSKTLFASKLPVIANGIMLLLSPSLTFQDLFILSVITEDIWTYLDCNWWKVRDCQVGIYAERKMFGFFFFALIKYFSSQNRLWDFLQPT